ncbi:LPS export ABC transporter periplasmic protein LptC [Martelella mediterranea]|uniref:Lipopolysaccharide export system protein LptC n=1 Tax=Martelella mediterranea TaxID=293089 RepID=A0A4R3NVT9_9HYPH|nr:LPS export ABC transporter periplasmic protein LptC [Martelella mediterranea]TCT43025.1 lipopolysaccharide export system protein LptC [Martelella mediterranea]
MNASPTTTDEQFRERILHEQTQRFKKAAKHSRNVKRLKILLPIAALLITLALIATTIIRSAVPDNISLDAATIENGKLVMTNPGMSGRNSDGTPYSLKAARALLPADDPSSSEITLEDVIAKVPMENDVVALVRAASAFYNRTNDQLKIDEPFTLEMSNGLTAHFNSAFIDVKNGTLESKGPFTAESDQASVVADEVNITDNGQKIIFGGGVHVTLSPSTLSPSGQ